MNRAEAEAILLARMAGAPNLEDYRAWLARQPEDVVLDLAQSRSVNIAPLIQSRPELDNRVRRLMEQQREAAAG